MSDLRTVLLLLPLSGVAAVTTAVGAVGLATDPAAYEIRESDFPPA